MRSLHRVVLPGLLLFPVLGCDLLIKRDRDEASPAPPPLSAPAAVAPAPSASPSVAPLPATIPSAPPVAPPLASAAPEPTSGPVLQLTEGAAAAGLSVNQLKVTPAPVAGPVAAGPVVPGTAASAKPRVNASKAPVWHEVTVYAVFGAPFSRRIELRAHDVDHGELGRSEREAALSQPGDSARYVTFRFDPRMPLDKVRSFDVHVDPIPEAPVEAPPPKLLKPVPQPVPQPEPQFIRPVQPGLVPKDP